MRNFNEHPRKVLIEISQRQQALVYTRLVEMTSPFASARLGHEEWGRSNPPNAGTTAAHSLLAQLQLLGHRLIAGHVLEVQVIEQTAALADHHEQTTARTVVFFVLLQVFGQVVDPAGEQGDLHIRRTCVFLVQLEISYHFRLRFHTSIYVNLANQTNIVGQGGGGCKAISMQLTA